MVANKNLLGCAIAMVALAICATGFRARADGMPTNTLLPLKVVGTQIENSHGDPVLLRGVNAGISFRR
jgi:hypothetical protein